MERRVSQIFSDWCDEGLLQEHRGADPMITGIAPVEECGPGQLVFVDKLAFVEKVLAQKPGCVVTHAKLAAHLSTHLSTHHSTMLEDEPGPAILISPNVGLAQALLRAKYVDRNLRHPQWLRNCRNGHFPGHFRPTRRPCHSAPWRNRGTRIPGLRCSHHCRKG